jgi:hypothetical protein
MRTTVDLDQAILRLARKRALESHRTLSQVMEEAMRRFLRQPEAAKPAPFTLITGGLPGGTAPGWDAIKRMVADEDEAQARRVADGDHAAP